MQLWILFCLGTVLCWGAYGPMFHAGSFGFDSADRAYNGWRALLCVGGAYFLLAVLIPGAILALGGKLNGFTLRGTGYSTLAGALGAFGAMCVLWSFRNGGRPLIVMALVFGMAPVVNAIVSIITHPPEGGIRSLSPMLFLGIVLAGAGAYLVMTFKPQ